MRKKLLVALVGLSLALLAGSGNAQTEVGIRFGIRPTKAYEDRPETFSYFSHELAPGTVLADEALVMNSGDEPVTLTLYAADGFTAINTGTAFTKRGQEATGFTRGVSRWLFFSVTEIALEPGEEMLVPFTISVPPDAPPGQHVAGLVLEAPPREQAPPGAENPGQFGAIVIQQAGVAVVIDVPGPHFAGLEITGTCLKEQGEIGATFEIDVLSRGNVIVKGEGSLRIMNRNAEELASVPLTMGAVLPGDATTFQVTHPVRLADGDYVLSDVLNYERRALNYEGKTAVLEGVEIKVKDGQPDVGCNPEEEEEAAPPFSITDIVPLPGDGGPWWYVGAGAGTLLALTLALLILILLLRKARRRRASRPPRPEHPSGPAGGAPEEASPDSAMSAETADDASEIPPPSKVVAPQTSEEDGGHLPADDASEIPQFSKVVAPQSSEEDEGHLTADDASEIPQFSKVAPPQSSEEDDGHLTADDASESPPPSKVVAPQTSEEDEGHLPAEGASQSPPPSKVVAPQTSEEDEGHLTADDASEIPHFSKVAPPQSSEEDDGHLTAHDASESPPPSKVVAPQTSEEDEGHLPAEGASESPPPSKVVAPRSSEEDEGHLPAFLTRQLQHGKNLTVLAPSEEAADAPAPRQTEPEEQQDDGRVA